MEDNSAPTVKNVEPASRPSNWVPRVNEVLFKPRKLKIVCVGGGFSGLMVAYKFKHDFHMDEYADLKIYEKNSDIGGTWLENRYPGVACDVPAHIYTFSFEPNPDWSSFYVGGQEIWQYIKSTARKHNLEEHIEFNTKVISTIWDEDAGRWRLKVFKSDQNATVDDEADILINSAGFLSKWSWPQIKGIKTFHGKMVHSASWDDNLDWTDKKVAIIGNGSSAIQILPQMQPKAKRVVTYIRSPTWISSNFASEFTPEGKNFRYSKEQKQQFRDNPDKLLQLRKQIEHSFNKFFYVLLKGSPQQTAAYEHFTDVMKTRLNGDTDLCERLIPKFEVGCRRLSPGDDYLEALQMSNVSVEFSKISEICEDGILTATSREQFDIIVCATGFDVSFCPSWDLRARNVSLAERWKDHPEAYFGTCVPDIPNYFIINGPNSPVAHGSLLSVMEWTAHYILRWCHKIATQNIKSIQVKADATDDYNVYTQESLKCTVWTGGCRSWFKNSQIDGRVTAMYPGSVIHFKEIMEEFRTEDFEFVYNSPNRFRFMGNGMTMREEKGEDLAYYIRK